MQQGTERNARPWLVEFATCVHSECVELLRSTATAAPHHLTHLDAASAPPTGADHAAPLPVCSPGGPATALQPMAEVLLKWAAKLCFGPACLGTSCKVGLTGGSREWVLDHADVQLAIQHPMYEVRAAAVKALIDLASRGEPSQLLARSNGRSSRPIRLAAFEAMDMGLRLMERL